MWQKKSVFILLLCFMFAYAKDGEVLYRTYNFDDKSFSLHVASSGDGKFLYAGLTGSTHVSCMINNKRIFFPQDPEAPLDGTLICNNALRAHFNRGHIKDVLYNNHAIKWQQVEEFRTIQTRIEHRLRKGISIALNPLCSDDKKVQNVFNKLYGIEFTCSNVQQVFERVAEETLGTGFDENELYEVNFLHRITYFDSQLFVVTEHLGIYSGGMHENKGEGGSVFDRNGNVIDMASLVRNDKIPLLLDILWAKLQTISTDFLTTKSEFAFNDNIAISYDGIDFIYQPYELLPYSYGAVHLTLSLIEAAEIFTQNTPIKYLFE